MVRSKEVPKKPKDPLLTPPSKPRRFSSREDGGFGGSLPRNRGGAAMSSPAPASVPSYMRATSSSGAKAGQRQRQRQRAGVVPSSPSASTPTRQRGPVRVAPRGKVLFPAPAAAASPGMVRPTCSSTLKEAKFPRALDLAPGSTDAQGPAAMRICPYTYCSLNGHVHGPAVPLRSFLATQRRLIKTQQSMKHKGVSAFRRGQQRPEDKNRGPGVCVPVAKVDEEALGDFFVEVYTGPRVSSGTSCSDMSLDEMDATVRRMEFVVFDDRCGADDDENNNKGNDLGVNGDVDGEGTPEEKLGVCRDSSTECSDAGISGNLVEELPWMRYQGYECDSLDDDVSEEHVSQCQQGNNEEGKSGGLGDGREEGADEEQKPDDDEVISDLPRETGIVEEEEEGEDCGVDTVYQQEDPTGQETQDPRDDLEIVAEQACTVCPVEVCKGQEEDDEGNILDKVCQGDTTCDGQGTSEEELSGGVCKSEIPECEEAERVENVLEDRCKEENSADQEAKDDQENMDSASKLEIAEKQMDGESEMGIAETVPDDQTNMDSASKLEVAEKQKDGESEIETAETVPDVVACEVDFFQQESTTEALSEGEISDSSIPECEEAERVENVLDRCKEENSADQEAKDDQTLEIAEKQMDGESEMGIAETVPDDQTNMDSASKLEIAENQKDSESETEIAETVPDVVACEEDFFQQESTTESLSEGEISDSSTIGPDVEASNQPTNVGFEQDVNTVEDAFEQDVNTVEDVSEQLDTIAENTVSGTEDAQLEITTCKSEDASEKPGIIHLSSRNINSVCVDAPAIMALEITEHEPEDSSEEFSIPPKSSQSDKYTHVDNGSQAEVCVDAPVQMEPEITECKLEDSSEESVIPLESDKSVHAKVGTETEPEFTTCKSKVPSEECGIAPEMVHDDNSPYLGEGAQMQLGNVTSELGDTSEESGIAQEIGEDDNSGYGSDDAQNGSQITRCELVDTSESVTVQEADQNHNCADVSDDAQNGSQITRCELVDASESVKVQEADQAHCADVSDGAQNESEITLSELANASEGSDVTQEAVRDDNTVEVNDGPQQELETMACESEHAHEELNITQIGHDDDCSAGALKDTKILTRGTKDACEEVCITEVANLSPIVQIPEHNGDLSATDGNGEPQCLPAEDTDSKEFSVDDMCSVFSGMNLKGDVYVDPAESEISPRKRLIIAGRRRTPEEEEYMRGFNPRAPNFLPLELDPDSEKVDLKHQTAEDRKNAEEWMIDYALRRAVNNLGGRKKKVELLVQAFETVLPHDEDEKKSITPTRPVQACS